MLVLFNPKQTYTSGMNNSFNDSIAKICGLELAALAGSYKYSVFGSSTAVVEGHKGIASYREQEVAFLLGGNCTLNLTGDNLQIKCLGKHFAVVSGRIIKVEVVPREK